MVKDSASQIELLKSEKPVSYDKALEFMKKRVAGIIAGTHPQTIWFLEHEHVYTAGTSSNDNELLSPNKIPVHKTGRGGKYTYHGPGQRVVYVMIDLKKIHNDKPDIKLFVKQMEFIVINSLAKFGIKAETKAGRIGVWVEANGKEEKIAAIGIRVEKWVTYHGFALNINPDLEYYKGIVPCGISEFGITSTQKLGCTASIEELDKVIVEEIKKTFFIQNLNKFVTFV